MSRFKRQNEGIIVTLNHSLHKVALRKDLEEFLKGIDLFTFLFNSSREKFIEFPDLTDMAQKMDDLLESLNIINLVRVIDQVE